MVTKVIENKDFVRTALKDVVIKSLRETLSIMNLEVRDDNISRSQSYQETIKKNLVLLKRLKKK